MNRSKLYIGEVASLLGISRKTIRHYHKLGLLPEADRSEGGYRLYSADDLFTLQRIRQMQRIGLSLHEIKTILAAASTDLLRETLQTLLGEINEQIARLQARQAQIESLLDEQASIRKVGTPPGTPRIFETYQQVFSDLMAVLPPDALETERSIWASLDAFRWPASYHEGLQALMRQLAERPGVQQQLADLNRRYFAMCALPPDHPEIDNLAEEIFRSGLFIKLDDHAVPMPQPFLKVFQQMVEQLTTQDATPAEHRFLQLLKEKTLAQEPAP